LCSQLFLLDVLLLLCSVSDILMSLEKKVDTSQSFNINVTREDLFQRGLKQWARQKQASPKNLLRVSFIGENGIDQGALRKEEFLTGMCALLRSTHMIKAHLRDYQCE